MKNTIIWFAIWLHVCWAVLLLVDPSVIKVTGVNGLYEVFPNRFLLSFVLLVGSALAVASLTRVKGVRALALLLPQQFLVIIPAIAVAVVIINGSFADGVMRPRSFLLADKIGILLLAVVHTICLLRYHKVEEIKKLDIDKPSVRAV